VKKNRVGQELKSNTRMKDKGNKGGWVLEGCDYCLMKKKKSRE
jgi:hypothetical protein